MTEGPETGARPQLEEAEKADASGRVALRPQVVHEAIRQEGETELARSTSAICSATARAITSDVPPAAKGTIMVIGRLG